MAKRDEYLMRDPQAVVVSRSSDLVLVKPGADAITVSGVDGASASRLLSRLVLPQAVSSIAESEHELVEKLVGEGIVLRGGRELFDRIALPDGERVCRNLVLGVSGAVYAANLVHYVMPLRRHFCERLDIVLTESARRFVVPEALTWLGARVFSDVFEPREDVRVPHIELAREADLVLVLPASAHTLHELASGACADLLSLIVTATRAPVVVAPSMSSALWANPAVRRNVAQLRADGVYVIEPSIGYEVSAGREAAPEVGGPGVSAASLLPTLAAVLADRQSPARKPRRRKR